MSRTAFAAFAALAIATSTVAPASPALAQDLMSENALHRTIHVPRDKSLSFRLPQAASRIVVANPEIAKVTATTGSSFYVQGIEFGSTNLLIYGPGGQLQQTIDVRVGYDAEGLQQDLSAAFPNEPIRVRNLGEMLMLGGEVSTTGVQAGAERIAERYAPDSIISRMTVRASEQVILEFRPYGVKLNFIPVIQDNGWIRLAVEPEVSQLDNANALTVNGVSVPALTVRRANTTLELKPGDSFAMAGLFQHDYLNATSQTPWVGDIPVLGALFRSARWRRSETELLILVTPRLATAADRAAPLVDSLPGKEPSSVDLFLMGKSHDKPLPRDTGPAPSVK
jgi:Flp pilus assembly secretin CpaC